jgi:hypothetical protein
VAAAPVAHSRVRLTKIGRTPLVSPSRPGLAGRRQPSRPCSASLQIASAEMIGQHAPARFDCRRFLQVKPYDSRACRWEASRVADLNRRL